GAHGAPGGRGAGWGQGAGGGERRERGAGQPLELAADGAQQLVAGRQVAGLHAPQPQVELGGVQPRGGWCGRVRHGAAALDGQACPHAAISWPGGPAGADDLVLAALPAAPWRTSRTEVRRVTEKTS